jgi:hypothetical protein
MATIGGPTSGRFSLTDAAKLTAPDGSLLPIAEILARTTPFIEDAPSVQGNLPTGHRTAILSGLPETTWRLLYQGVPPTKGEVRQLDFEAAELTQLSSSDMSALELNDNKEGYLMKDARMHLIGMGQDAEENMIYGDRIDKSKFPGFAIHYNTISTDRDEIGYNVVDGGGTGADNTSMYMVFWGDGLIYSIYPKGSKAGLEKITFPPQMIDAPIGTGRMYGIETLFKWKLGLCFEDWRACVRIANIDVSDLADAGESSFSGAELINLLIKAYNKVPNEVRVASTHAGIYCNETVKTALDLIANNKTQLALKSSEIDGQPFVSFWGIPIKKADKLLNNEAAIT